jgi:MFS family permease
MASDAPVRQAYLWTSILNAPFWALYGLLLFILHKDLHASAFAITLLIALRPIASLFSIYWSALVYQRPDRLRANVIAAGLFGHLSFFFVPFFAPPWFLVTASTLYMLFTRGIVPAWMEILKMHVPNLKRERLFSLGSVISYLGGIILSLFFGSWLDLDSSCWRFLFPITALLSLCGTFVQWRIPMPKQIEKSSPRPLKETLLHPWKMSWQLMQTRPDFWKYQIGFLLGGSGLMILQPALPTFFLDRLHLSFTELALAFSICKGFGFASTSHLWAGWMSRFSFYRFSSFVTLLAALFPPLLLLAQWKLGWIYIAYLIYGIMQAGSHLSWHLSGPYFAKQEESSSYTAANLLAGGLRGLIIPFLGSFFCLALNAPVVLILGSLLSAAAFFQLNHVHRKEATKIAT